MKILHLYSDLLNLYGEYGNVEILKKHLIDQGFEVKITKTSLNSKINFNDFDFIYCGSGLESNLKIVLKDLLKHKESLLEAINNNKYILFTGNSMELLGESIDNYEALNIIPMYTTTTSKRFTGDVIVKNDDFNEVVGFINKSTMSVKNDVNNLFTYVFKDVNLKENSNYEGYRINNLIGTHLIGPLFVKNPQILRYFVEGIGKSLNRNFKYKNFRYDYEDDAYYVTLNELKKRIK